MKKVFMALFVAGSALVACSNAEESARELYNRAAALQREGNFPDSTTSFEEIVADYPQTTAATDANDRLDEIQIAQRLAEEANAMLTAVMVMRDVSTAQITFLNTTGRYAESLEELVDATLLDAGYLSGTNGYMYRAQSEPQSSYSAVAIPDDPSGTHLYLGPDGVVRYEEGRPAASDSLPYGLY